MCDNTTTYQQEKLGSSHPLRGGHHLPPCGLCYRVSNYKYFWAFIAGLCGSSIICEYLSVILVALVHLLEAFKMEHIKAAYSSSLWVDRRSVQKTNLLADQMHAGGLITVQMTEVWRIKVHRYWQSISFCRYTNLWTVSDQQWLLDHAILRKNKPRTSMKTDSLWGAEKRTIGHISYWFWSLIMMDECGRLNWIRTCWQLVGWRAGLKGRHCVISQWWVKT